MSLFNHFNDLLHLLRDHEERSREKHGNESLFNHFNGLLKLLPTCKHEIEKIAPWNDNKNGREKYGNENTIHCERPGGPMALTVTIVFKLSIKTRLVVTMVTDESFG